MPIKLVIAVTDAQWYHYLASTQPHNEVNFWSPSARDFRALRAGELFLFKLKYPRNFIVGGGLFSHASIMPLKIAWDAFGVKNGAPSLSTMQSFIIKYKSYNIKQKGSLSIGCRIISSPFFLRKEEWLPVPSSWSPNIVSFKTFDLRDTEALALWEMLQERVTLPEASWGLAESAARFGAPQLIKPRLGQGAFRFVVTDAYSRKCTVTGEKTLPALEVAHIKPYSSGGCHEIQNGLLLRRDIHSLFDSGYTTITNDYRFEVNRKIKEEFENGKDYYKLHGKQLSLPSRVENNPDKNLIEWHNDNVYLD